MVTVSEVIVGLRSEGAQDTKDDLDSVSDKTEETTAALDEQSDEMTDMAQSFTGALQAATVGLAAASAGLLSQVPVLGQVFDGLFAIVEAVALQMDQVLRPVLGPLSKKMFGVAESISSAEGAAGDIIGVFGTIVAVLGTIAGAVVSVAVALGKGGALVTAAKAAASAVAGAVGAIISAVGAVPAAIAAVVIAIGAAIAVILTDFRGWRTKGIKIIKDLWERVKEIVSTGVAKIKEFGSNMFQAGKALIERLKDGIIAAKDKVVNAVQDIINSTPLPDLGVAPTGGGGGGRGTSLGGGGGGGGSSSQSLPGSRSTTTKVYLNGREVGRGTNGERFDESARRGQTF